MKEMQKDYKCKDSDLCLQYFK
uniref:Uncharacterized protein n=1 Tax=Arundo donax TaxID=35708 RepID=A0A0A9ELG0_ARUDO